MVEIGRKSWLNRKENFDFGVNDLLSTIRGRGEELRLYSMRGRLREGLGCVSGGSGLQNSSLSASPSVPIIGSGLES